MPATSEAGVGSPREADPAAAGTITFIVTTENGVGHCRAIMDRLRTARREGDEVILLVRADRVAGLDVPVEPWFRVVPVAGDVSSFGLRREIPLLAAREWVVLLEEHSLVTPASIDAARELIRERTDIDLGVFLARNLTVTTPWGWATFLYTFVRVWAPLAGPPAYVPVTAAIVRRGALGTERLRGGAWEFEVVPRLLAGGRFAYSNDVYIDHVKPVGAVSGIVLIFHNARACAHLWRGLGRSPLHLWSVSCATLIEDVGPLLAGREAELPRGTRVRLRAIRLAHLLGISVGLLLGGGRSAHKLD
jgi:hypothetical protein